MSTPTLTRDDLVTAIAELMTRGGFPTTTEEIANGLDSSYQDWELDSLAHLELMIAVGNRFGIAISDSDALSLKTPAATVEFVTRALRGEA